MHHRVDEARQYLAVVGEDVEIVDCHHRIVCEGDKTADRRPDVLALAGLLRGAAGGVERDTDHLHSGAFVSEHDRVLRQAGETFRAARNSALLTRSSPTMIRAGRAPR